MKSLQDLIEPVPIDDDLCSGLIIEDVEVGARCVFYASATCYETGAPVLVVKRKIVLPLSAFGRNIEVTAEWLARRGVHFAGARLLRLVR